MAHKALEEIIGRNIARYREAADAGNTGRKDWDQYRLCLQSGARTEKNEGGDALCHGQGPRCEC